METINLIKNKKSEVLSEFPDFNDKDYLDYIDYLYKHVEMLRSLAYAGVVNNQDILDEALRAIICAEKVIECKLKQKDLTLQTI